VTSDERGPVLVRYEVSADSQRALATLRAVCALLALAGSAAMLLGKLSVTLFLTALLAVLLSVAWLAQARRLRRAARETKRPALVAHRDGLLLEESTRNEWLPWSDLARIEVDEERLDIVVTKRDTTVVRIEPRYQGVDLYELVHTLNQVLASDVRSRAEEPPVSTHSPGVNVD
jgi:hypothetical protein